MDELSVLSDPNLLLIFASAPAGLGHLRVTRALYHGLPKGTAPMLMGSTDPSLTIIHRIMSLHPIARKISEYLQEGKPEDYFARYYRIFLRKFSKTTEKQLVLELKQRLDVPKTVLVIATHFGLAHQIAQFKDRFSREHHVRLLLAVQVTDDTPQHIWYVPGADITFTPSEQTKQALIQYGKEEGLPDIPIVVTPYPVCPEFIINSSQNLIHERFSQFDPLNSSKIHVSIPISGAAVGLSYHKKIMAKLHVLSNRFHFYIVSKAAPFTYFFLSEIRNLPYVSLSVSPHDRETVEKYERLYKNTPISLEITKPSEQAFKALINPDMIGGSILLFTEPVGKQERDNIAFLTRHQLIPDESIQTHLWNLSYDENFKLSQDLFDKSKHWRAMCLPPDADKSAIYINWCLKNGFFQSMLKYKIPVSDEVSPDGVHKFWLHTAKLLS